MAFLKACLFLIMLAVLLIETGVTVVFPKTQEVSFITIPYLQDVPLHDEYDLGDAMWAMGKNITAEEVECLATNIYFESRSEPILSQYAVGEVVMHRVMHFNFPNTVCEVVKDAIYAPWDPTMPLKNKCQFSWFCNSISDAITDHTAYGVAEAIARDILVNPIYKLKMKYSLFYHADYVSPDWRHIKIFTGRSGVHLFYL